MFEKSCTPSPPGFWLSRAGDGEDGMSQCDHSSLISIKFQTEKTKGFSLRDGDFNGKVNFYLIFTLMNEIIKPIVVYQLKVRFFFLSVGAIFLRVLLAASVKNRHFSQDNSMLGTPTNGVFFNMLIPTENNAICWCTPILKL